MELLTSEFKVQCDTFSSQLTVKQHEVDGKRKIQIVMFDAEGGKELSLWAEDAQALGAFLFELAQKSDKKL